MTLNERLKRLERLIERLLSSTKRGRPDPLNAELDRITTEILVKLAEQDRPLLELVAPVDSDPETFRVIQHELAVGRGDTEAAARFAPPPEPAAEPLPAGAIQHPINEIAWRLVRSGQRRQKAMDRASVRRGSTVAARAR